MSSTGKFFRCNSIIYIERIESLARELLLTFQQPAVHRTCIQGTSKLKCKEVGHVDIALVSLRALYQSAGLVGGRNFGANCTSGAVIQDKFATNPSGGSVPNACLLTIDARGSGIDISGRVYDIG